MRTNTTKPKLNFIAFAALGGLAMGKLTAFEEYSAFGFNFFPMDSSLMTGFAGTAHLLSTLLVYMILLIVLKFVLSYMFIGSYKNVKRKREISKLTGKKSSSRKIPLISWYIRGAKMWFSDKREANYNFGMFIFFNFVLLFFNVQVLSASMI